MRLGNREANAQHHTAGVHAEVWWEFAPGTRVITVENIPGVVTGVEDGGYPGQEQYVVKLDGGLGGGAYSQGELRRIEDASVQRAWGDPGEEVTVQPRTAGVDTMPFPGMEQKARPFPPLPPHPTPYRDEDEEEDPDDTPARRWYGSQQTASEVTAGELHLASDDYPELVDILVERPPHEHSIPVTGRFASVDSPVQITAARGVPITNLWDEANANREKYANTPSRNFDSDSHCVICGRGLGDNPPLVEVSLDGHPIPAGDARSNGPESQGHWPIGSECIKRVVTSAKVASLLMIPASGEYARQFPGSFIGNIPGGSVWFSIGNEVDDGGVTIHAVQVEEGSKRQGIGTQLLDLLAAKFPHHAMDPGGLTDEGAPFWESWVNRNGWPEVNGIVWLESEEDFLSENEASLHTAGIFDWVNNRVSPDVQVSNTDLGALVPDGDYWCRFRRDRNCYFPKDLDASATDEAGYAVWVPNLRGPCPYWSAQRQQNDCPVSEPGPESGEHPWYLDATRSWDEGGQRGGHPEQGFHSDYDATPKFVHASSPSFRFHVTAAWRDVREKAVRIRENGGVQIVAAAPKSMYVTAYVTGDHGQYETRILRQVGHQSIAMWECGCDWAKYSWGRSGRWKHYEGRMCAHALALVYEAQAREMFGGAISEDAGHPHWRVPDKVETPHGAWGLSASLHEAGPIDMPPLVEIVSDLLAHGHQITGVANMIAEVVSNPIEVDTILSLAMNAPPFPAKYRGQDVSIVDLINGRAVLGDGEDVPADQIVYPTWHPSIGLGARQGATNDADEDDPRTWAGYVKHVDLPGKRVVLVNGHEQGISSPGDSDGKWALMCDPHGGILTDTSKQRLNQFMRIPEEWCPYCQDEAHPDDPQIDRYNPDRTASVHLAEGSESSGIMVALDIPAEIGEQYRIEGGESTDEMHLTLAYIKDASQREGIEAAVAEWVALIPTLVGTSQGWGTFFNGEQNVLWVAWDVPGLAAARTSLVAFLMMHNVDVAMDHDFTAHMTVLYTEDDITELPPWPGDNEVTFENVSVAQGDDWKDFPFGGSDIDDSITAEANTNDAPVPMEPGQTPLPPGTVRGFHYTNETNIESIKQHGITTSHSRGEQFGEPNGVWMSATNPYDRGGMPQGRALIETAMPADEKPYVGGTSGDHAYMHDISPSNIIAIHEGWHAHYRYMKENKDVGDKVRAGDHDSLLSDPDYRPAIERIKREGTLHVADSIDARGWADDLLSWAKQNTADLDPNDADDRASIRGRIERYVVNARVEMIARAAVAVGLPNPTNDRNLASRALSDWCIAQMQGEHTAAQHVATTYWHGTRWPVKDSVDPGHDSNWGVPSPDKFTYFTTDRAIAENFAQEAMPPPGHPDAKPYVYEVQPTGEFERDKDEPEFESYRSPGALHIVKRHPVNDPYAHTAAEETLHPEPEPALPRTDGDAETAPLEPIAWLMNDGESRDKLQAKDRAEIAVNAKRFLKEGVKAFSPTEQATLIHEGADEGVGARNLSGLDLSGTQYEALEAALSARDDEGDDVDWLS